MPTARIRARLTALAACLLAASGLRVYGQAGHQPAPLWDPPPAAGQPLHQPSSQPPWGEAGDASPRVAAQPASFNKSSSLDLAPGEARREGERMELKPAASEESSGGDFDPAGLLVTTGSSLAVVLGLFFLVMWLVRGGRPDGAKALPTEVWQVLGRGQLDKTPVRLVRCGGKLLLLTVVGNEVRTLTEIGEPAEVARLSALCGAKTESDQDFRQVYEASRREGKARRA